MHRRLAECALAAAMAALCGGAARAADHRDGPAATADPSTDINDVYSWTSMDGNRVYLVMTVFPAAGTTSQFSNAAYYVFHTASRATFATPANMATPTDVVCSFDPAQKIQCWVGSDKPNYVTGDASIPAGIASRNGRVRVFAGLRDDPFFFNLDGFNATRTAVKSAVPALVTGNKFDGNGCPALDATTAGTLVNQLKTKPGGTAAPENFFARLNTLAIVLEIDRTLLNKGGPILSVWAGTHKKN